MGSEYEISQDNLQKKNFSKALEELYQGRLAQLFDI